jgi:hypothetical protein
MKLAVVGSRTFINQRLIFDMLDKLHSNFPVTLLVSGGAKGPDSIGASWAKSHNIPTQIILPNWDKYGKSAGFKRNITIVEESDWLIAFWDGQSNGTAHSINLATNAEHIERVYVVGLDGKLVRTK